MPQTPAAGDEAAGAEFQTVPLFEPEAEAPRRGRYSPAVFVAGGVLLAGALAAGYYVWSVAGDEPEIPKAPSAHLATGAPAAPMPIPDGRGSEGLGESQLVEGIDGAGR